jgi:hypothetical protein
LSLQFAIFCSLVLLQAETEKNYWADYCSTQMYHFFCRDQKHSCTKFDLKAKMLRSAVTV